MHHIRQDKKLEAAVNRGLAAALLVDVAVGVRVMTDAGVPPEIMARLFLAPQLRRSTDWKH